jgi:hypothetical protein
MNVFQKIDSYPTGHQEGTYPNILGIKTINTQKNKILHAVRMSKLLTKRLTQGDT